MTGFFLFNMGPIQWIKNTWQGYTKGGQSGALKSVSSESIDHGSYNEKTREILFGAGGSFHHFSFSGHISSLKAYTECAPVTSVINRKAQAYGNGKTWILNDKDNKEATSAVAAKLRSLLARPNPLQTWTQFELQGYIYQQIFGWSMILPIKPVGFTENIEATSLWNIPPTMVDIEETRRLFYQSSISGIIERIVISYSGMQTELKADDVFFLKDVVPSFESLIFPESRLCALSPQINNIIGAYESRNVLINYRGALGLLSSEKDQYGATPLSPDDKDQLQEDFKRYGLKNRQWKIILTSAALKWQQMGYSTKDLMLFEEIEDDIMRICDAYNYPYQLMSSAKGSTYSNVKEGKQLLYQDATIPESKSNYEQLNIMFNTSKYGIKLDKDYSHVAVLQEDKVQAATARKTLDDALKIEYESGLITINQWLEKLDEDTIGDAGDVRATDVKNSNVPLAVIIGVGGVESMISVLTAPGLSEEGRSSALQIIFGLSPDDANRMVAGSGE